MSATITFNGITSTWVAMSCANCGMAFGVPKHWNQERRDDHRTYYCPNGHSLWYPYETEAERLERQLAAANGNLKWEREVLERERKSHAATKGQLTKTRKRIQAGVCPECRRSFQNVARHMNSKHPEVKHG